MELDVPQGIDIDPQRTWLFVVRGDDVVGAPVVFATTLAGIPIVGPTTAMFGVQLSSCPQAGRDTLPANWGEYTMRDDWLNSTLRQPLPAGEYDLVLLVSDYQGPPSVLRMPIAITAADVPIVNATPPYPPSPVMPTDPAGEVDPAAPTVERS